MTTEARTILAGRAPARPPWPTLILATVTATAALLSLVAIGTLSGQVLLIPPMAASMALIAAAPTLPLSQPRNVVGGQLISAAIGVAIGAIASSYWTAAVAGGLALGVMLATRTAHSPAAATAVLGVLTAPAQWTFVLWAGVAAVVLVLFGLSRARLTRSEYPTYWW